MSGAALPRAPRRRFSLAAALRGPLLLGAVGLLAAYAVVVLGRSPFTPSQSGFATLGLMAAATFYAVRRRSHFLSLRLLRPFTRFALLRPLRPLALQLDRMHSWRLAHLVIGSLWALFLGWHVASASGGFAEQILLALCIATLASGVFGALVQYAIPQSMLAIIEREVRIRDVDERRAQIFKTAEERILGKSELVATAYIENVRPVLQGDSPRRRLFEALVRGQDPGAMVRGKLWHAFERLGEEDAAVYRELVDMAEEKGRLDLNRYHLELSTQWLTLHDALVAASWAIAAVHLISVAYY